jgi:hypothetical protein
VSAAPVTASPHLRAPMPCRLGSLRPIDGRLPRMVRTRLPPAGRHSRPCHRGGPVSAQIRPEPALTACRLASAPGRRYLRPPYVTDRPRPRWTAPRQRPRRPPRSPPLVSTDVDAAGRRRIPGTSHQVRTAMRRPAVRPIAALSARRVHGASRLSLLFGCGGPDGGHCPRHPIGSRPPSLGQAGSRPPVATKGAGMASWISD